MATEPAPTATDELPDPNDRTLFPLFDERQLAIISRVSKTVSFAPNELLFDHGDREVPFFLITSGSVQFFDRSRRDNRYFAVANAGTFIGDIAIFTGEATLAACVAAEPTTVLAMDHQTLRTLVMEHGDIGDLVLQTMMARRTWLEGHGYGRLQLIGPRSCPCTFKIRDFLARNLVPFIWIDTEADRDGAALMKELGVKPHEIPVLIGAHGVYRNPAVEKVASCLGLRLEIPQRTFDLVVVGAGPAGLAAAVYGASEGLSTVLIDGDAPGGQAGTSSKIENYLGFATGISGQELTRQAVLQARKFGALLSTPMSVMSIECQGREKVLTLDDQTQVRACTVVLATGARYRKLEAAGCDRLTGMGMYYAATHLEARQCQGSGAVVVGGGNSAGQAAMFLCNHASHVTLVVRRNSLQETMSQYLIDRLTHAAKIEILYNAVVTEVIGDSKLEAVKISVDGTERHCQASALFAMVGAEPHTDWLDGCCGLDNKGFVVTGLDAPSHPVFHQQWSLDRDPFVLETTRPGVFAVGDVRSGSIKRVATAVGEGAMAVKLVHEYLAESRKDLVPSPENYPEPAQQIAANG